MLASGLLPLLLMGSAFALPGLSLLIKNQKFYRVYALAVSVVGLAMASAIFLETLERRVTTYWFGGFRPPLGIVYTVDLLGAVLGLLSMFILVLSVAYSGWLIRSRSEYLYYTFMLSLGAGSVGCLYTGDIFNFFVMLEVLSLSAYVLVSFYRDNPKSIEASIRYALVGMVATSLYLLAAFIIYGSYGTLNMADVALKSRNPGAVTAYSGGVFGDITFSSAIAIALSVWTFTFKAAVFPNHFWLPDANPEAPTPVSALFVAVIDLVGAYGVARFLYTIFGSGSVVDALRRDVLLVLHVLGALSAVVGALLLLIQVDIKKFIAYSTISHMGLAFMALTVGTEGGLAAAVVQLISNSLSEALLFYTAGVAIVAAGRSIEYVGVLRRRRLESVAFLIGILNLFGIIPPLLGFWSKVFMFTAFLEAGYLASAVVLVVSTGISGIGYVKLINNLFREAPRTREDSRLEKTLVAKLVIATATTALLVLGASVIAFPRFMLIISEVGRGVADYLTYVRTVLGA
ncbi:MAG: proton-conducting transporter membrane subunit [Sulfolobales archaeon]|nr:proton-conducting transporter membrane subunit [Sulfolobales archaeon]